MESGVVAQSKVRSIASRCSSVRCTAVLASRCCVGVCCPSRLFRRDHKQPVSTESDSPLAILGSGGLRPRPERDREGYELTNSKLPEGIGQSILPMADRGGRRVRWYKCAAAVRPSTQERRRDRALGEKWCRRCQSWLTADAVIRNGLYRERANEEYRERSHGTMMGPCVRLRMRVWRDDAPKVPAHTAAAFYVEARDSSERLHQVRRPTNFHGRAGGNRPLTLVSRKRILRTFCCVHRRALLCTMRKTSGPQRPICSLVCRTVCRGWCQPCATPGQRPNQSTVAYDHGRWADRMLRAVGNSIRSSRC